MESFNIKTFGRVLAFAMAVEARELALRFRREKGAASGREEMDAIGRCYEAAMVALSRRKKQITDSNGHPMRLKASTITIDPATFLQRGEQDQPQKEPVQYRAV